jgi:glycosyltransferase involved in cell wall biosynthesis
VNGAGARRIRILFLITQFDTGGVQFQLYLRLRHLDARQFDARVLVLTGGSSYLLDKVRALGVPVDVLHLDDCSLASKVLRIRRAIAAVGQDIVDAMFGWGITYGNAAATLANVPFIVAEIQNERGAVTAETSRAFRLLQGLALRCFCDTVVCCSYRARDSYLRAMPWLGSRTTVIHDAIDGAAPPRQTRDADRAAMGIDPGDVVIGTIGRLVDQKDHATLVRATARVVAVRPDAVVLIAGYGQLREQLESQIAVAGLKARVRLLGEITDPQRFYALVDVFVLTSRWEGFPVVLLEAMAATKAVVATEVGGIAEMIEHGRSGLLCSPGDDERIAAALLRLLEDAVLRGRYAAQAHERVVSLFSIQRLISEWEHLYASGVGDRAGANSATPSVPAVAEQTPSSWPASASRILVWRLCPFADYSALVQSLRARYPQAVIDGLCQTSATAAVTPLHAGGHTLSYGEGAFTLARLGVARLLQLRNNRYDLAVVPYNTAGRSTYKQAETAAAWISPGRAYGVTPSISLDAPASVLRATDVVGGSLNGLSAQFASLALLARAVTRGLSRRPRRGSPTGVSV